jgi:hypothetical protein
LWSLPAELSIVLIEQAGPQLVQLFEEALEALRGLARFAAIARPRI